MSLLSGTSVGAYEIIAALGAGGMGEVYRARDTRLGREIALKVLPISRHDDAGRRARFEREALTLASLNHPHIATIHDVIDIGDRRAIVMELVSGPTLAQLIARGPVRLRDAIGYAIEISGALAVAHAAGIVHRDLKPANIAITTAGSVKVLDFGIAKLGAMSEEEAVERETMSAVTERHAIVGTPGYLSPEQAQGRPLDGRSDIFTLGIVLHEMISGRRTFEGDSTAALLSAVLRDDPHPLRTLNPATPRSVERVVARCLEKDPQRRYQNTVDLKAALEDLREDLSAPPAAREDTTSPTPYGRRTRLRALTYVAATLAFVAVGFVLAAGSRATLAQSPTYRPFVTEAVGVGDPVWSPDGRTLAYVASIGGTAQIFLKGIGASQATQLTRSGTDGVSIFWSPDASRIYFTRAGDGNLVSVSAGGGEPQLVTTGVSPDANSRPSAAGGIKASLNPDGHTLVFSRGEPGGVRLWTTDLSTGKARALDAVGMPQPLANVQALAFSPDGRSIAAIGSTTALNDARGVWLISWPGASARHLFADAPYLASNPSIGWFPDSRRFVMNGYPLHGGTNRLLVADVGAGILSALTGGKDDEGGPSLSADGSRIAFVSRRFGLDLVQFRLDGGPPDALIATSRDEMFPDMSASGLLAYVTDADGTPEVRVRSGSDAWARTISGVGGAEEDRPKQPQRARLSPDGARIAVETYGSDHLIWIYPTAGGAPVRLDSETTDQHGASWSPDGNWIAYRRLRNGVWELVKVPLGGGAAVRLDEAVPGGAATDWSSTGQWIVHPRPDGMHLVSPDGASRRVLAGLRSSSFRFSRDGSQFVAVRRGTDRRWEVALWDVATAREVRTVALPLASTADVVGMTLSADGSRIIVGAGTPTSDIWILEHFDTPAAPWSRWLRQ